MLAREMKERGWEMKAVGNEGGGGEKDMEKERDSRFKDNTTCSYFFCLPPRITQICGVYDKGHIRLNRAFLYIGLMNAVSQIIALHSLIYFYKGTRKLLKPLNPVGKFLSIKAIVFFTFW